MADLRRLSATTGATSPAGRWPTRTRRPWARSSPSSRSRSRWRSAWPRSAPTAEDDELYRLTYDGSVNDEPGRMAMGGQAEAITGVLKSHHRPDMSLRRGGEVAVQALSSVGGEGGAARTIAADQLEVAVLDRRRVGADVPPDHRRGADRAARRRRPGEPGRRPGADASDRGGEEADHVGRLGGPGSARPRPSSDDRPGDDGAGATARSRSTIRLGQAAIARPRGLGG